MKVKLLFMLLLFFLMGFSSFVAAQVDSDGDLNCDSVDPAPSDPSVGAVFPGVTITYDVLLCSDLDATGFTGTVITISADGVTFDGNGHQIIAPNAGTVILLGGRSSVTVENVNISGDPASPDGFGVHVLSRFGVPQNNIVRNVDASFRSIGIRIEGAGLNNTITDNIVRGASSIGIDVFLNGQPDGGNHVRNNDVRGGNVGIQIFRDADARITLNTITGNSNTGLHLTNSPNAIITRNNIFNNTLNAVSNTAIELSFSGEGNYWGRSCPGPLFVPGVDSNSEDVVDSFPCATFNGWLAGW